MIKVQRVFSFFLLREAISRVCEAVPGAKGGFRKQKPPRKVLSNILGKSNLQFAGMNITLNISTTSLNLMTPDSKQIIANHHMQSISFASGGDPDTTDYVAYVAKDPVNHRGSLDSHNMPEGKSQVTPPGEVPIYVNTQRANIQVLQDLQGDTENVFSESVDNTKDNNPRKDLFDMRPFEEALKNQTMEPLLNKAMSVESTSPVLSRAAEWRVMEELKSEPWYQGEMSRKEAEQLLKKDGDFLVRKSTNNTGSYVLTGMHNGQIKHLLLVDPEGTVRTKDQVFDSISHLINHHLENNLPIISAGSELCLQQPVQRKQ
ncbi:SHC-transforming protein 3-like [Macrotis lagotis]|uniref:SHC-transforming protein 3-like n=1 Tax=Macrotis lagotis TaxID=92651 RepID=UPI003D6998AB